ncbi:hypothetical protein BJF83_18180 [Nocardiopsis sp. CNR-923]|uniref:FAD-binding protein n=1 Tax=Nocardiopsis sp. CNR-923 TaxID=1904965 RepID=UPI000963A3AC|nr:FAD-binding protein [Nocardiopsis sp. CNR-923]OLT27596.1 hypothetical protein BJF83_18180 [Nocardiopsis sp. CNR-923]
MTIGGVPSASSIGLRGVLSTREDDLDAAARDFGNMVSRRPLAVLYPADAADVAAVARFGRSTGTTVVARGTGHSVDGQAQAENGIVVDLRPLSRVRDPAADRVSVDAGARWSDVVRTTLRRGLVPPVLPDLLDLSVGGTLSVGGFGGASHRYGYVADNVAELEVVTPDGRVVVCSPDRAPDLFDAVRGTQGRYGTVTRATVGLVRAGSTVHRHRFVYSGLGAFLADQRRIAFDGRFDHVEGRLTLDRAGVWTHTLDAAVVGDGDGAPGGRVPLDGLRCRRSPETWSTAHGDFLHRYAPLVAQARRLGGWERDPHPRYNVLLPGKVAETVIAETLEGLTADGLGEGGSVLVLSFPTERLRAPGLPRVRDPLTVLLGVQRTAPRDDPAVLERMRRFNDALRARALGVGGFDYAGGARPAPTG